MPFPQIDLRRGRTRPLASRPNKVSTAHFGRRHPTVPRLDAFVEGLPRLLAADALRGLVDAICTARERGRPVVLAMGAHVLKTGLTPLLQEAVERRALTAFALNSAGSIHDYELSLIGATSEDVAVALEDGSFGMWEETGAGLHRALREGVAAGLGYGEAVGRYILDHSPHPENSLLATCTREQVPATVHAAIGTDIIHMHPEMDGAVVGEASFTDFKILCHVVSELEGGGVWINCGSSVILPEVFLKAVSLCRNQGYPVAEIVTANLDMIRHYRPHENVLSRPTSRGGRSYQIVGHHEILVPLLLEAVFARLGK
ncbi:MAG: hypothetical protein D6739_04815 [Nitrospirae bacterium]|nr:MAG: hypothetical protein D6739_04815 [Nitrospirota bacterium]